MRPFLFILLAGSLVLTFPLISEPASFREMDQYSHPSVALLKIFESVKTIPPDLIARAAVVYDPEEDEFLFQRDQDAVFGIASITKIMTALVVLERIGERDMVIISAEAVKTEGAEGGLVVGEHLLIRDLITLMMTASSNDAASAVAEHTGRLYGASSFEESQQVFVRMMNERAQELGLTKTKFENPTGLDTDEEKGILSNVATATDVARLVAYVLQYSLLRDVNIASANLVSADGISHLLSTTHELLRSEAGIVGGKTGFTDTAGGVLVTVAEVPLGKLSIIVVLGSTREDRFTDTKNLLTWLRTRS